MMSNNWVDFRLIKERVTMLMVLDHYKLGKLKKSGGELRGECPIHKGGGDAFHVNPGKNAFNCFFCKAHGNVLDFVAAMEQCSVRDAGVKLQEWFSITADAGQEPSATPKTETKTGEEMAPEEVIAEVERGVKNKPLKFQLRGIDSAHPYLAGRGVSRETAESFGLGFFAGKGSMSGRVVIPIHNSDGELVAYAGRSTDGSDPKYKFPAGFHKSLELYNLHRVTAGDESKVSTAVLVEGFFDCMNVHQAGYPCVALMGSSMSEKQEEVLTSNFTGVVIMLDGDEAGRKGSDDCLLRLGRKIWARSIVLLEGKQPDQLGAEELSELLHR